MNEEISKQIKLSSQLLENIEELKGVPEFEEKIQKILGQNVTEVLGLILGGATKLKASDIHFEPQKESVKLRVRID